MLADQQKATTILAAGGKADEHFPKVWAASFEERQVEFDAALAAEPSARRGDDTADFLREMGLVA